MSILDAIKNSVLEGFDTALSATDIVLGLAAELLASLFILYIYMRTMRQVSFNRSFCVSLLLVCSISAMMVLTITSNLALSLGMVGALSIVRFRTAVKEPADTAFLFWAIAAGIITGAGYVTIAVLSVLLLGLLFVLVHAFGGKSKSGSYMVVARFEDGCGAEQKLAALPGYRLKNMTMIGSDTELVAEVRLDEKGLRNLSSLRQISGVREISVMHSVSNSVL